MFTYEGGSRIELVSSEMVAGILKRGANVYHTCYEVFCSLEEAMDDLRETGALPISEPTVAVFFAGRRVVFMMCSIGILELLETPTL